MNRKLEVMRDELAEHRSAGRVNARTIEELAAAVMRLTEERDRLKAENEKFRHIHTDHQTPKRQEPNA